MFKLKNLPMLFLFVLLLILIFFQAWTFYLGTTDVTFERLMGSKPYSEIKEMSLRRYKEEAISPHLFTITSSDDNLTRKHLVDNCNAKMVEPSKIPPIARKVDKEMVEVMERSPYIYVSQFYDLAKPELGRMCVIFRDNSHLYLFMNGNL